MIRTLIVDDDALVARTMGRMLSRHVEVVDAVCDASTALARLEHDSIDVLITDFDLGPGMTGRELAESVKKLFPQIRIIMVSGSFGAFPEQPSQGTDAIDAFFPKPVRVQDLLSRLQELTSSKPRS
jgi:CheY-like chemotaxis protein